MPPRPLRPCRNVVCPKTTRNPSGYCDICEPDALLKAKIKEQARDRARGTAAERGYDRSWRRIRQQAMIEAGGLCADCKEQGRYAAATEVHHADGNSKNNTPGNLVPLCKECHDRRHGGAGAWRPSIRGEEAGHGRTS